MNIQHEKEAIKVQAGQYILELNKSDLECRLLSPASELYTVFPSTVRVDSKGTIDDAIPIKTVFSQAADHIVCEQMFTNGLWQKKILIITVFENAIEVSAEVYAFKNAPVERVTYFRTKDSGIFAEPAPTKYGYLKFTPRTQFLPVSNDHPDNHYTLEKNVMIDGGYFEPPPLNLSFACMPGYVNIGACKIPPSTRFCLEDNGIVVEEPNNLLICQKDSPYAVTPVVFTFSNTPWEGIVAYRIHLASRGYLPAPPPAQQNCDYASWWLRPTFCTFGEMMATGIGGRDAAFNLEWCRQFFAGCERDFYINRFNIIVDEQWEAMPGDPEPDKNRFSGLRRFVDECHGRDIKVILWWIMWKAGKGSLAEKMDVVDRDHPDKDGRYDIDATSPNFDDYIALCMQRMLGNGTDDLDADGLKLDGAGARRGNPVYRNPVLGIGWQELHRYLAAIHTHAKRIKPEALISASSPCPHFADVQDIIRLHDLSWDWRTIREERARITALSIPFMLIDSDVDPLMDVQSALYYYATVSVYSSPSVYFLNHSQAGFPIPESLKKIVGSFLYLSSLRRSGQAAFVDYGIWRWEHNGEVLAETLANGTGLIVYPTAEEALLSSVKKQPVVIPLRGKKVKEVSDEEGHSLPYVIAGDAMLYHASGNGEVDRVRFEMV